MIYFNLDEKITVGICKVRELRELGMIKASINHNKPEE